MDVKTLKALEMSSWADERRERVFLTGFRGAWGYCKVDDNKMRLNLPGGMRICFLLAPLARDGGEHL